MYALSLWERVGVRGRIYVVILSKVEGSLFPSP
jgi:hypothetical protein